MKDSGLARRYAQALFTVAKERQADEEINDQLRILSEIIARDRSLRGFLGTPRIAPERKDEVLRRSLGGGAHRALAEFLVLLRRKGRLRLIDEIADKYREVFEEDRGIVRAQVRTAVAMTADERRRLIRTLEARTGRTIVLQEDIVPDLIGGVLVVAEGQIIDGTIRHQLDLLRDRLRSVPIRLPAEAQMAGEV
jgi:F-type H+-transporting ATPase subunit delta